MTNETVVEDTAVANTRKVDIVLIDRDPSYVQALIFGIGQRSDKVVEGYNSVSKFLNNFTQYSKDTKICMSYVLGLMNGISLAERLHEAGYTKLYLHTAWDFAPNEKIPDYLIFLPKARCDIFAELLKE